MKKQIVLALLLLAVLLCCAACSKPADQQAAAPEATATPVTSDSLYDQAKQAFTNTGYTLTEFSGTTLQLLRARDGVRIQTDDGASNSLLSYADEAEYEAASKANPGVESGLRKGLLVLVSDNEALRKVFDAL